MKIKLFITFTVAAVVAIFSFFGYINNQDLGENLSPNTPTAPIQELPNEDPQTAEMKYARKQIPTLAEVERQAEEYKLRPLSYTIVPGDPPKFTEIVPRKDLLGGPYPFCGENDDISLFEDAQGKIVSDKIPWCSSISIGSSETNLKLYEILSESSDWFEIRPHPTIQVIDNGNFQIAPPPDYYSDRFWMRKSDAMTAWTIRDGDKNILLQAIYPIVTKQADGTWLVEGQKNCEDNYESPSENNSDGDGLKMHIRFDYERDCGT